MHATVVLGQQGRLVIPAEVREALELVPGDQLVLQVHDGCVVLERQVHAAARLRGLARDLAPGRSLVDELLAERRAAAARE